MRITCPHCGARDAQEFAYLGDATLQRPVTSVDQPIDDAILDRWHDYVYLRDNPAGEHQEYWYHQGGCHQWLVVTRDVRTHAIPGPAVPAAARGRTAS
jgi:methylglutamate dehydrogenase subunit B